MSSRRSASASYTLIVQASVYNQIVRRTVYIVEIVIESKNGRYISKEEGCSQLKKPAAHPKYSEIFGKAIAAIKERGGSSRQAILKYIMANFNVGKDAKTVNVHFKLSLRAGVKNKSLKQSKGSGASGSFKIGEVVKPKKKPAAKPRKAVKTKGS